MQARDLESKSASSQLIGREEVEAQLSKVLASAGFRNSQRRSSLLHWLVRHALDENAQPVKEYEIGIAVFEKPESWDPQTDSAVRVEVNRVRGKLREYYESEGQQDEVRIDLPARGYVPAFNWLSTAIPPVVDAADPVAPNREGTLAPPEAIPDRRRVSRRWIAAAAIGSLAVVAVGAHFLPARSAPPLSSIAVLPFLDLSPNHQDEYLGDGFTDELTDTLALIEGLRVVARTSAFQFKGKSVDVREIGRELGVGAVVEGSVLRSGDTIRVVAQLNRTSDGMHLWAATYDHEVKGLFRVQDEITGSIAEALRVQLTTGGPGAQFDPGEEAHDLYLHGVYEDRKTTAESLRKATSYLENAIRLAPRYALAYGQLGATYMNRASFAGLNQTEELRKARRYLEDAVALDPGLGWAEGQLAYINYVLDWDWRGAEPQFQHALAVPDPGNGSRSAWGVALMTRGRFAESQEQFAEAIARDPLNLMLRSNFATTLAEEGRFADASEQLAFCFRHSPDWFGAHLVAIYNAIEGRRPSEALIQLEKATQLAASNPRLPVFKACAWIEEGRRTEALALLKRYEDHPLDPGVVRFQLALAYALAGDADRMFLLLGQSADDREQQILRIKVNPLLASYQSDPRMVALERRVGLLP